MIYKNSGITFNNVERPSINAGGKITGSIYNVSIAQARDPLFELTDNQKGIEPINAIDIDWNGAYVGNDYINTTGELLQKIFVHENKIKTINDVMSNMEINKDIINENDTIYCMYIKTDNISIETLNDYENILMQISFSPNSLEFSINDNSLDINMTIDRVENSLNEIEECYSLIMWPKKMGTYNLGNNWKPINEVIYNDIAYYYVISYNKTTYFIPAVFKK